MIDPNDTVVHNQATLRYRGNDQLVFSNVVAVKIVTKDAPTATAAPTNVPTTAPTVPVQIAGGEPVSAPPEELGTKLPHTSGGIPLSGFVLLGLTLLLHSIRSHRARIRI